MYKTIYKEHHKFIPIDNDGRSFEIHHIDGNHANNCPENLKAVTIQEHYDIHYAQGDWAACHAIAMRMAISPEIMSELATKANKKRVANGTNPFLGGEIQRQTARKRLENGTHHFLDSEFQKQVNKKRLENGTHNFIQMVKNGTHPAYITRTCPHCGKTGKGSTMFRWHFDNCRNPK